MRRSASDFINELEMRIAKLEGKTANKKLKVKVRYGVVADNSFEKNMSIYDLLDLLKEIYKDSNYLNDNVDPWITKKPFDYPWISMSTGSDEVKLNFESKSFGSHRVIVSFSKNKYLSIVSNMDMDLIDAIKEQMRDFFGVPFKGLD